MKNYGDSLQQVRIDNGLPEFSEEELAEHVQELSDLLEEVDREYEIWIDKKNYHIRKIDITQSQLSHSSYGDIEYIIKVNYGFSMINGPITIEPPLDEDGYIAAGWLYTTYEP